MSRPIGYVIEETFRFCPDFSSSFNPVFIGVVVNNKRSVCQLDNSYYTTA